jgi:L-malate glycosyltransferase
MSAPPVLVLGSASVHVQRFVRGLCAAGRQVVLATHGELALGDVPGLLHQTTVDLRVASLTARRDIRALIQRWRPGLVHAHQANSVSWHAVAAAAPLPVVVTLWGSDVLHTPQRSPAHRWLVRRALGGASAWTADAQVLLQAATALAGPGPLQRWIPLGLDHITPAVFDGVPRPPRMLSCRLHKPLYRIDAILRAFARLPASHADWALEVAAAGIETEALQNLAAELQLGPRVVFTGMLDRDALQQAYQRSALFVSVPQSDGTSVSLLEAMAAGCLPLLSSLPANREWVHDGQGGVLCADVEQLHHDMARAISLSRSPQWLGSGQEANRQKVLTHAFFPRNIEQFIALHDELLAKAAR